MLDYTAAMLIWDSVYVRIVDVYHGLVIQQQKMVIDENCVFLFASGKRGRVQIDDSVYILESNGLFHVKKNVPIVFDALDGEMEYYIAAYQAELAQSFGRERVHLLMQQNPFDTLLSVKPANAAFFAKQFHLMVDAWHRHTPISSLLLKQSLYAIVHEFYVELLKAGNTVLEADTFEKAKQYLEHNYAQINSVQLLADVLGISRATLYEQFMRKLGKSPKQYLMQLRLDKACIALRNTSLTLNEIAVSCGLRDKDYFSRIFKKYYDMAPGAYRKLNQKEGNIESDSQPEEKQKERFVTLNPGHLLVENFGRLHRYDRLPGRIVCLNYQAAEICIALGMAKHIVGFSGAEASEHDCLEQYQEAVSGLPRLLNGASGKYYPSFHTVCECHPDLIIGSSFSFSRYDGVGDAAEFEHLGIHVYALKGTCILNSTFEDTYEDIFNLGKIFGREERACELVSAMRVRESELKASVKVEGEPVRVFSFDAVISDKVLTCGQSLESYMIRAAGGVNIFESREQQFIPVDWEEIAESDPEIILVHRFLNDREDEEKCRILKSNPIMSKVSAIQNERIYFLGFKKVFPGIDNIETAFQLAGYFNTITI